MTDPDHQVHGDNHDGDAPGLCRSRISNAGSVNVFAILLTYALRGDLGSHTLVDLSAHMHSTRPRQS